MGKRLVMFSILIFSLICLSGCDNKEISDENASLISEYAANSILNHDTSNKDKKVTDVSTDEPSTTEVATEQTAVATTEASGTGQGGTDAAGTETTTENITTDLSALFETPNLTVTYDSYEITDSYEKGSTFLDADKDSQLIVAHFIISNQSTDTIGVNFLDKAISYELGFNDEQSAKPMLTILEDDLSTYSGNIKAGKSKKVVLLFEVDKSMISSVNSLVLKTSYHGMDASIKMK